MTWPPEQPDNYCPTCSGRGHVYIGFMQDGMSADYGDCPDCGGSGFAANHRRATAIRRFTVYRLAVPDETHNELQKNAPEEAQFEGVVFTDGTVALRWRTAIAATSVWASLEDALAIHGHPEYGTVIVWHDDRDEADLAARAAVIEHRIVQELERQGVGIGPLDGQGMWHISGGVTPQSSGVDVSLTKIARRIAELDQ
jgi:hypothetical protein